MSAKNEKTVVIDAHYVDLVMEGGGVKGIGLLGAVEELEANGYQFPRIAGTSAGAIAGALLAAGMPSPEIRRLMLGLDFKRFQNPTLLSRFGLPGKLVSAVLLRGMYKGDVLHEWISKQLAELGVQTFKDLKLTEEWALALPPHQRYRLVVMVADVGRGRLLRLPWDYSLLGLDPDSQLVADAVCASAAIPFFYRPVKMSDTLLVDGGLLSNFPVDVFDDHAPPATWPTFGIKLSAKEDANMVSNNLQSVFGFPMAVLDTLLNAYDQSHLDNPTTTSRTIFVDAGKVRTTDFNLSRQKREALRASGKKAAKEFLKAWDYEAYVAMYVKPKIRAGILETRRLNAKKKRAK